MEGMTGSEKHFNALQESHSLLHVLEMRGDRKNGYQLTDRNRILGKGFGIHKILTHGDSIFAHCSRFSLWG